jgi:predicted MFS family arabinose efflux permease
MYLPSFKQESGFQVNYLDAFRDKRVLAIFTYIFFISLLYHGAQQWFAVYFSKSFFLNQFTISMLVTLTSLSGVFGEIFGGKLADKSGRLKTMEWGLFLMVVSLAALFFKSPVYILSVIMIIWGMGWTFNHAGVSALLTDLPKKFVNEAASLNSSVRFISGGLGALAANVLILYFGFKTHFGITAAALVILGIAASRLLADVRRP